MKSLKQLSDLLENIANFDTFNDENSNFLNFDNNLDQNKNNISERFKAIMQNQSLARSRTYKDPNKSVFDKRYSTYLTNCGDEDINMASGVKNKEIKAIETFYHPFRYFFKYDSDTFRRNDTDAGCNINDTIEKPK